MTSLAFAIHSSPGVYALLLGSGTSLAAEIPTGWSIVEDLIRRVAAARRMKVEGSPTEWYAAKFKQAPDYSTLLDQLARTPAERQAIIRQYIEPTEEQRSAGARLPTKAHKAIAGLVASGAIRLILTTNFDRLIEKALDERGVSYQVIDGVDALSGSQPYVHSRCTVVKVHGDYQDARIRNTVGELAKYEPELDTLLDQLLDSHGLIISGWSATWDPALRSCLERQKSRRFSTYWCLRGDPSDAARDLIRLRDAAVISGRDADAFFAELESKLVALAEVARPHPLSVATAVAELKRYMPDRTSILRLEDLVLSEAERVAQATTPELFPAHSGPDDQPSDRVKRYEAICEVLVAMLVFGCSHSMGKDQDRIFSRAIERIAENAVMGAGTVALMALRRYPALYCEYLAGFAAFASDHLDTLFELWWGRGFDDDRRSRVPLLPGVSPAMTFENVNVQEAVLPEVRGTRRHTPFSDHLRDATRAATRTVVSSETRFDELFDRFEYLQALALEDAHDHYAGDGYVPGWYAGRWAWRRQHHYPDPGAWIGVELALGSASALIQAGLFGGDSARLREAHEAVLGAVSRRDYF